MAPSSSTGSSSRPLRRAGLAGVACLALAGLGTGSAVAAGNPVVPLTPTRLGLALLPSESLPDDSSGLQDMSGVGTLDPTTFTAVPSAYGGTLSVHLPPSLDGAHLVATLDVPAAGAKPDPTKDALATSTGASPTIRVTASGKDTYDITLPASADLTTPHGDDGYLELSGLTNDLGATASPLVVLPYRLGLGAAQATTELDPVLFAAGEVPGTSVAVGGSLDVTLPTRSALQALGVSDLSQAVFVLQALGADGKPTGAAPVEPDQVLSGDGATATLTVPAGTPAGAYALVVIVPDSTETTIAITVAQLTVTAARAVPAVAPLPAAPAAPAAAPARARAVPAVHRGLRSNTDWADHAASPGTASQGSSQDPWLACGGAAALLAAAAGAVGVRRSGRRSTTHR